MDRLLRNKVALVTGCDTGIGKSICKLFVEQGATVYANILNQDSALILKDECKDLEGNILPVVYDITDKTLIIDNIKTIKNNQRGRLDILVNNAGVKWDGVIEMVDDSKIDKMFAVNVIGTIHMVQGALRLMKRNPSGASIINISSLVGLRGNVGQSVYGATKGAVASLTKSWAKEFAPQHIRVNAVAPGSIDTGMFYEMSTDKIQESIDAIGLKRLGTPEEVAKVILFLASDLSSYVTGEIIGVDGGLFM
ncbi:MAG: SDR family oxidoreductase [Oribacterium sp.]|nr:SDR family oxidoreductase [Oribacterium sp.]